jgi:hypothetical protein
MSAVNEALIPQTRETLYNKRGAPPPRNLYSQEKTGSIVAIP